MLGGLASSTTRSWYSQLLEQIANTAHVPTDPEGRTIIDRLTVEDGDQFRLGGEYSTTLYGWLFSFRAGAWHDPLHRPYLVLDDASTGWPAPGWSLLFPKRKDETHVTGGIGLATARRLQLDFAIDHAQSVTIYALSAIYRF